MLNGMIYSARTDISRTERDPLMWGPEFVTSGIFIVPKDTPVSYNATYFSIDNELTLVELYKSIYEELKTPFAVVGCLELEKINAEAITRAPIENENIFKNAKKYYEEEEYTDTDVNIAIMAVVSDPGDESIRSLNQELSSVLYYNPFADKNNLLTHTHGLLLNKPIIDIEKVHPKHGKEVFHVQASSLVRYAKLKVYKIEGLDEFQ